MSKIRDPNQNQNLQVTTDPNEIHRIIRTYFENLKAKQNITTNKQKKNP